jgi:cytidylate kinase
MLFLIPPAPQVIVQGWPGEGKTTTVLRVGLAMYEGHEVDSTYVGSFRDVAKEEDIDAA